METMYAIFDGEFLIGLFPYEEDAQVMAARHIAEHGNKNMVVQEVSVTHFEFPVRK